VLGNSPAIKKIEKETSMIRTSTAMKLLATFLLTLGTIAAQSSDRLPVTDAEKIADALRAGPTFITKDATVLDWPSAPGREYRVLRKGSNEWTCLPAIPGYPHDEPGCFDPTFLRWMQDSLAGRTPHIDRIGISYMYFGAWVKSARETSSSDRESGPGRLSRVQSRRVKRNALRGAFAESHRAIPGYARAALG
jgi:hypothetical protein